MHEIKRKCTPRKKKRWNTKQTKSTKTFEESVPHAHIQHTQAHHCLCLEVLIVGVEQLYKKDRNKEVLFWPDMNVRNITEADRLSCYKASRWRSHDHRTQPATAFITRFNRFCFNRIQLLVTLFLLSIYNLSSPACLQLVIESPLHTASTVSSETQSQCFCTTIVPISRSNHDIWQGRCKKKREGRAHGIRPGLSLIWIMGCCPCVI